MRRHIFIGLLPVLLIAMLAAPVWAQVVVTPGGLTLAEALATVPRGGEVVVSAGVYTPATLTIDRPLTLRGAPGAILDGEGERALLLITADSVTVRGLTFRNVGTSFVEDRAAVKVDAGHHCVIAENRFEDTFFAVYLAKTDGCVVEGNVMRASGAWQTGAGNGVHLWYSKNARIEANHIEGHRDGIYLEFVEDSIVRGNTSTGNLRYGLHFMFSDRCRYEDNTFRANEAGVAVMYAEHVEVIGNRFEDNRGSAAFGLLLKDITDSRIEGNRFADNTVGIYAEGVNRTPVRGNDFLGNGWAVKIMANAQDNTFGENNFIGNTFDVATNSRRTYSTFAGNYWDRYAGYDLDRDGVGEVPFHPVRLFTLLVEQNEPALVVLRSFFVDLLDAAERMLPVLTPATLIDTTPRMIPFARPDSHPLTQVLH